MSAFDRIRGRSPRARRRRDAPPAGLVPADKLAAQARREALRSGATMGEVVSPANHDLHARRERLTERFALLQADLGGVFYEMAIRDHVRLDVLTRKAAELQRVDAELLAVERLLELERLDAAGLCGRCGAPYGAADRFCPQCGNPLVPAEAAA